MDNLSIVDGKFAGHYRATVIDNADPYFLGRVKVRVYPMFNGMAEGGLPWATPALPMFTGAGSGFGNFVVPEVGSEVFVFFENQDPYQPVIFAEAQTRTMGLPADRKTDAEPESYPFIKVKRTKNSIQIKINDYLDEEVDNRDIRVDHPSGSWVEFYPDGRVTLHTTTVEGKILIEADAADIEVLADKGDIAVNAKEGDIDIVADKGDIFVEAKEGPIEINAGQGDITAIAQQGNISSIASLGTAKVEATVGNVLLQAGSGVIILGTSISVTGSGNMDVNCAGNVTISGLTVQINPP